jgi:thiamine-phosphate pyrophosphorylase
MHLLHPKKYYFISNFDQNIENKLKKYNKIGIIYKPKDHKNHKQLKKILRSNLTNKIYLNSVIKYSPNLRIQGIYLPSDNKNILYNYNLFRFRYLLLGSAHNLKEIFQKIRAGCSIIFLSNIYKTSSHPHRKNSIGLLRFLNIKNQIKNASIYALGGVTRKKYNSLNCIIKNFGYGGISSF